MTVHDDLVEAVACRLFLCGRSADDPHEHDGYLAEVSTATVLAALSEPKVFDAMVKAAWEAYCDDGDAVYIPSMREALRAALGVLQEEAK